MRRPMFGLVRFDSGALCARGMAWHGRAWQGVAWLGMAWALLVLVSGDRFGGLSLVRFEASHWWPDSTVQCPTWAAGHRQWRLICGVCWLRSVKPRMLSRCSRLWACSSGRWARFSRHGGRLMSASPLSVLMRARMTVEELKRAHRRRDREALISELVADMNAVIDRLDAVEAKRHGV